MTKELINQIKDLCEAYRYRYDSSAEAALHDILVLIETAEKSLAPVVKVPHPIDDLADAQEYKSWDPMFNTPVQT